MSSPMFVVYRNFKIDFKETGYDGVDLIYVSLDMDL